jgi:predicted exporter
MLELDALAETVLAPRLFALLQPLDGIWIGLVPLSGISGAEAVEALHRFAGTNGLHYLDLREAASDLLARFMDNTLRKMFWAALVILVVLLVALRNVGHAVTVLTPIIVSTSLTLAILLLLEPGVNVFHLVSLLLVVGLAIDYSLFFNRPIEEMRGRARTLLSVSVCALSSFAMFGMLALSDIPALHSIGLTVALGIATSFPAALLLGRSIGEVG